MSDGGGRATKFDPTLAEVHERNLHVFCPFDGIVPLEVRRQWMASIVPSVLEVCEPVCDVPCGLFGLEQHIIRLDI